MLVVIWIVFNGFEIFVHFDKYPFTPSTSRSSHPGRLRGAADLARPDEAGRSRQGERSDAKHRESLAERGLRRERMTQEGVELLKRLIEENTALTEQIHKLTGEIHRQVAKS